MRCTKRLWAAAAPGSRPGSGRTAAMVVASVSQTSPGPVRAARVQQHVKPLVHIDVGCALSLLGDWGNSWGRRVVRFAWPTWTGGHHFCVVWMKVPASAPQADAPY